MSQRDLLLITTAFPSKSVTEEVFVVPELEALSRSFSRVIIVPLQRRSLNKIDIPYSNVTVDFSIADSQFSVKKWRKAPLLFSRYALANLPSIVKSPGGLRNFLSRWFYCMNVELFRRQLEKVMLRNSVDITDALFYTFWFDYTTVALAEMASSAQMTIISRAHGYDIYDRFSPNRPPHLRRRALHRLAALYPVSKDGKDYLGAACPECADKIKVRILGSTKSDPEYVTPSHSPKFHKVTILSVARMSPEKAVERNPGFIKELARRFPEKSFKWIHVGDGPCMNVVKTSTFTDMPSNLSVDFRGALPNNAVHAIYHEQPIDWTLLLSDSEGCPIAVSESLSYGVPVIASRVGGLPEIVTPEVGVLVMPGTSPADIVGTVAPLLENPERYDSMKQAAFTRWMQNYSAPELRSSFAAEISQLKPPV